MEQSEDKRTVTSVMISATYWAGTRVCEVGNQYGGYPGIVGNIGTMGQPPSLSGTGCGYRGMISTVPYSGIHRYPSGPILECSPGGEWIRHTTTYLYYVVSLLPLSFK